LWKRFASVVGIDSVEFPGAPPGTNNSLGAVEAAVIRRINEARADEKMPWPVYARQIKNGYARALARRASNGIELPEDVYEWAVESSTEAVDKLRQADYHVVGDLADLIPQHRPTGADPDAVSAEEQLDAALAGLVKFAAASARRQGRSRSRTSSKVRRRPARTRWVRDRLRIP
jgi:hypothetical protein